MPEPIRRPHVPLRRLVAAGGLAVAMSTTAFAGVAGASDGADDPAGHETEHPGGAVNLLACIAAQGVTAPGEGGISDAWIDQVVAAARACGVELPEGLVAMARRQAAEAEARRQCLANAGVTKPAEGQPPTPEQIVAFKAALVACGLAPAEHKAESKPAPANANAKQRKKAAKAVKRVIRRAARR